MPVAVTVALPPDAVSIARRLAAGGAEALAVLESTAPGAPFGRMSYVACDPDASSTALDPAGGEEAASGALAAAPRWIGVVPYEARRALERGGRADARPAALLTAPRWWRYPAVVAVDHATGRVAAIGETRDAAEGLAARLAVARELELPDVPLTVTDAEPALRHAARIRTAQELLRAGDLYQVNLARALDLAYAAPLPAFALALHARLRRVAPTPFAAVLLLERDVAVVSTSPELLLDASPRRDACPGPPPFASLLTVPIKGTRPRGRDAPEDAALAAELDADPKERAELTMIVDVERNDLGRVAVAGSVRASPPRLVAHRTVHHREAEVRARVRDGVTRAAVLEAILPSGSVTGAPKVRAMEVIADLEPRRRGLYTGAIGFVGWDGGMRLAMAIRTAVLVPGGGEYLTGGGIVEGSDPAREVEETRWKALQLARLAP